MIFKLSAMTCTGFPDWKWLYFKIQTYIWLLCHPDLQGARAGQTCVCLSYYNAPGTCSLTALNNVRSLCTPRPRFWFPYEWITHTLHSYTKLFLAQCSFHSKNVTLTQWSNPLNFQNINSIDINPRQYLKIGTEGEDTSLSQMNLPFVRRGSVRCFGRYRPRLSIQTILWFKPDFAWPQSNVQEVIIPPWTAILYKRKIMKLAHILTGLVQQHNDMMNTRVFLLKFYTNERWYHCYSKAQKHISMVH